MCLFISYFFLSFCCLIQFSFLFFVWLSLIVCMCIFFSYCVNLYASHPLWLNKLVVFFCFILFVVWFECTFALIYNYMYCVCLYITLCVFMFLCFCNHICSFAWFCVCILLFLFIYIFFFFLCAFIFWKCRSHYVYFCDST